MRKPNWIYIIPKHRKLRTTSRFLAVVPSEAFFILRRPPQGLLLQTPSLREPRLLRRVSRCSLFQTCGKSGSWSISTPLTYNILMPVWRSKRSEEHTSELQSRPHLVCRLLLEKKKKKKINNHYTK